MGLTSIYYSSTECQKQTLTKNGLPRAVSETVAPLKMTCGCTKAGDSGEYA